MTLGPENQIQETTKYTKHTKKKKSKRQRKGDFGKENKCCSSSSFPLPTFFSSDLLVQILAMLLEIKYGKPRNTRKRRNQEDRGKKILEKKTNAVLYLPLHFLFLIELSASHFL
jgi:hypothetical protein